MIDFIKNEIRGLKPEQLRENLHLEFHNKVNVNTGELGKYINAYYKGLEFKIYEPTLAHPNRRITLEGSLHKYWNNGKHNFNDFGVKEIEEVLNDLKNKFNILPQNCIIRQLEIGVNITPPLCTTVILNNCFLHKTKRFKWIFTKDEGNYIQVEHQRYILKIYDKRKHYKNKGFDIVDDILRIEMKYRKMHELNQKGIYTLADLLNYGLHNFTPQLLKEWDNVLYYDETIFKGTKSAHTFSNPNYWENLTTEQLKYRRKKLNNIYKNNPQSIKNRVSILIQEKTELLVIKIPQINTLPIGLIKEINHDKKPVIIERKCCITGISLTHENESAKYIKTTTLKYLHDYDQDKFIELCSLLLNNYDGNRPKFENNLITHLAKQIRNRYYSQNRYRQSGYNQKKYSNQIGLFN